MEDIAVFLTGKMFNYTFLTAVEMRKSQLKIIIENIKNIQFIPDQYRGASSIVIFARRVT